MTRAVSALGGNLGDRAATLEAAIAELDALQATAVVARSSLHETAALKLDGVDESAPRYLNAVVVIETELEPTALHAELERIERAHGRVRAERWGDRTLDLDLIDVDGVVSDDPRLTLPHPRTAEREFVLAPWLEADPDARLTGAGSVRDLLTELRGGVR